MKYAFDTLIYFVQWGMLYGVILGAWSTTLMFPVLGTMFGSMWGAGIGTACGLLCGGLVAVIQAYTFHPDVDLDVYRRRLSIGIGLLVGIMAPLILMLTSQGILWGERANSPGVLPICLIAVIFWGGLSAAYVGHGYPLWLANRVIGRNDTPGSQRVFGATFVAILKYGLSLPALTLGGIAGLVIHMAHYVRGRAIDNTFGLVILNGAVGIVAGIIGAVIITLMITAGTVAFIVFVKRLLFSNDTLTSTSHYERVGITLSAVIFVGLLCCVPLVIFVFIREYWPIPIVCALLTGVYVYRALPLDTDKAKRKEQDAALSDAA